MATFADSEAEESVDSNLSEDRLKNDTDSSEDDEIENEDELLKKEAEGFIVDEAEEEDVEESDSSQDEKDDEDSEMDIQDEVADLIDNTKKRSRLQRVSDDEDEVSEKRFRIEDDYNGQPEEDVEGPNLGSDEEDEDDLRNFIVDANDSKSARKSSKKTVIHDDPQTQEAQELFGVDLEDLNEINLNQIDEDEYSDDDVDSNADSITIRTRKNKDTLDMMDVFDPTELDRGFYTAKDEIIKKSDIPERFQLRGAPFGNIDDLKELEEEAKWMYQELFATNSWKKEEIVDIIKEVLNLLKIQLFEPPFIATYRKEHIESAGDYKFSLTLDDLWKIYFHDEKWIRLQNRKKIQLRDLERVVKYLEHLKESSIDEPDLVDQLKKLNISDIKPPYEILEFVKTCDSLDSLKDCLDYFKLYYDNIKDVKEEATENVAVKIKPSKSNPYTIGKRCNLTKLIRYFGLSAHQFAEHVRDQYAVHEVDHCPMTPSDAAEEFICSQFPTRDLVLRGIRSMLAYQISCEPEVIKNLRNKLFQDACISVIPTKKGKDEIDEHHCLYSMKYLMDKPITGFDGNHQFLYIENASQDHLITYNIYLQERVYSSVMDKYKSFFHRDEYNIIAQQWNEQRSMVIKQAIDDHLIPRLTKEIRHKLLKDAQEALTNVICEKIAQWINVQPFIQSSEKDDSYDDKNSYGRILGMTYILATNRFEESYAFAVIIDGSGDVLDKMKLPSLMYKLRRKGAIDESKKKDLEKLTDMILKYRPNAVAIATDSIVASNLQFEIAQLISTLENQHDLNPIPVELVDNELSIVYQNSKVAETDYPSYPSLLRQAISVARRLQDPLSEFAQLMNVDQEMMNLRLHPLQDTLNKDNLLRRIEIQFVNVVNKTGADINDCINHKNRAGLLQFVCGLGPRKADHLMKTIKKTLEILPSRNLIIQQCDVGPKVGMNCLGFIKINHLADIDYDDVQRELLDSTRIHPESYELAKKMAIDALEWDDRDNQAAALEEIMESPEKLRDLDLEAFAEELKRTEHGSKHITLNDIRKELTNRFEDIRPKFRSLDPKEKFELLTKESPETLDVGTLVQAKIVSLAHRKPQQEQLDNASPKRNEISGYWICPFCHQDNFVELNNVWEHFDSQCPGKIVGVYTELHNKIRAFLATKNISDSHVTNIQERLEIDMIVHARVIKIDHERMLLDISTKSSDLQDLDKVWRKSKDLYYDERAENEDKQLIEEKMERQKKVIPYINRVIFHPQFKNITYCDFEKMYPSLDIGEFIIRPSSKGANHLTISWKVDDNVIRHIDILEENKDNDFSLGNILIIDGEKFEDLDEIIASYIQPMANFARDAQSFKYYKKLDGDNKDLLVDAIRAEKISNPNKIPYFIAPMRKFPGRFIIVYLPETKERFDNFKITPKGFIFRNICFNSLINMIDYFKAHFNDRPSTRSTPINFINKTPMIGSTPTFATPTTRTPKEQSYKYNRNKQGPETPSF